jgi:superfamily II DNA or RNA helicase
MEPKRCMDRLTDFSDYLKQRPIEEQHAYKLFHPLFLRIRQHILQLSTVEKEHSNIGRADISFADLQRVKREGRTMFPYALQMRDSTYNRSLLALSAHLDDSECVSILLALGHDPKVQDKNGDTFLHLALRLRHPDVVQVAHREGCDVTLKNIENGKGETCLELASRDPRFQFLYKDVQPDSKASSAIRSAQTVDPLGNSGSDKDCVNNREREPLPVDHEGNSFSEASYSTVPGESEGSRELSYKDFWLTPEQDVLCNKIKEQQFTGKKVLLRGLAGTGKTFVGMVLIKLWWECCFQEAWKSQGKIREGIKHVLYVCPLRTLAYEIVKYVHEKRKGDIENLRFCFANPTEPSIFDQFSIVYKVNEKMLSDSKNIQFVQCKGDSKCGLVVVDEIHRYCEVMLAKLKEKFLRNAETQILLYDPNQGNTLPTGFMRPYQIKELYKQERCTKEITKSLRQHLRFPSERIEFKSSKDNIPIEVKFLSEFPKISDYAGSVCSTLKQIYETKTRLKNKSIAILVPDNKLLQPLQEALQQRVSQERELDRKVEFASANETRSRLRPNDDNRSFPKITIDKLSNVDGLEWSSVIAVGFNLKKEEDKEDDSIILCRVTSRAKHRLFFVHQNGTGRVFTYLNRVEYDQQQNVDLKHQQTTHNMHINRLQAEAIEAPNRSKPTTVKELMALLPRDSNFDKVRKQLELMKKNKATRNGLKEAIAIVKDKSAYSEHETRMTRWLKFFIERETTQNECVGRIANALLVEETSTKDNAITPNDIEIVKSSDLEQMQKQIICKFLGQMLKRDSELKYGKVADAITDQVVEAIPDIAKRMKAWRKPEDEGLRAQIEVACGVGKTHIAIQFIEKLIRKQKNEKTIIVVFEPTIELIRQTMRTLFQHLPGDIKATMKVCTVCSIGMEEDQAWKEDTSIDASWKERTYGKQKGNAIVSDIIQPDDHPTKVIFMTYQSSEVLATLSPILARRLRKKIDLMVFDEAHMTYNKNKKSPWRTALNNQVAASRARLFMTATAGVRKVQHSETGNGEVTWHLDMKNNVQTYGKCVYELDFRSAINKGLITDFQIVVIAMKRAEWMAHKRWNKKDLEDFPDMSLDALMGTKEKGNASGKRKHDQVDDTRNLPTAMEMGQVYALLNLAKDKDLQKLLTFNSTILDSRKTCTLAERMSKTLIKSSIKHYYVDARMLTLGYDLPQMMQGIGIMKLMQNPVGVAQILGRALRIDADNTDKIACFMLPYFVDETEDAADDAIFFSEQEPSELPRPAKRTQGYAWSGPSDSNEQIAALKEWFLAKQEKAANLLAMVSRLCVSLYYVKIGLVDKEIRTSPENADDDEPCGSITPSQYCSCPTCIPINLWDRETRFVCAPRTEDLFNQVRGQNQVSPVIEVQLESAQNFIKAFFQHDKGQHSLKGFEPDYKDMAIRYLRFICWDENTKRQGEIVPDRKICQQVLVGPDDETPWDQYYGKYVHGCFEETGAEEAAGAGMMDSMSQSSPFPQNNDNGEASGTAGMRESLSKSSHSPQNNLDEEEPAGAGMSTPVSQTSPSPQNNGNEEKFAGAGTSGPSNETSPSPSERSGDDVPRQKTLGKRKKRPKGAADDAIFFSEQEPGPSILLGHEGERHWTSMQCNLPSARPWGKKKGSIDSATDEEKEEAEHADLLAKLRRKWTRGLLSEEQIQQLPARLVEQWEEKRGEGSESLRRANNAIAALCSIDRALDTARRDYVSASKYLEGFCSRSMLKGDRWKGLTDTREKKIEALKRILETEGNSLSEKKKKKIEAALERYKRAEEALKRFVKVETRGGSGSLKDIADSVLYRAMEANTGKYEIRWEKMFQLVKEYKEEHGGEEWDGHVPARYSVTLNEGTKANVGQWVANQKRKRRKRIDDGSDAPKSPEEKRLVETLNFVSQNIYNVKGCKRPCLTCFQETNKHFVAKPAVKRKYMPFIDSVTKELWEFAPQIKNADETIKTRFQNEFDPTSKYNIDNNLTKEVVENRTTGSNLIVGWKCSTHNETWVQKIHDWAIRGINCPKCKQERAAKQSGKPQIKNADETIKTRFQNEFDPTSPAAKKAELNTILSRALHKIAAKYSMLAVSRQRVASLGKAKGDPKFPDVTITTKGWSTARDQIDRIEALYLVTKASVNSRQLAQAKGIESAVNLVTFPF